ncbi:hypothetical protein REPUB_Repub20aG0043300 [Reevesia pubescens]
MVILGRDLKALQRVAEPSVVRGEDFLASPGPCVGAGRSGSEAQVVMQMRGERSSLFGHAHCRTKRRASGGQNGISYVV